MGSIIEGSCPCGYRSGSLFLGASLDQGQGGVRMPAVCRDCRGVIAVDLGAGAPECPECGGTDLKGLGSIRSHRGGLRRLAAGPPDLLTVGAWSLPDLKYACPSCGERRLRFVMAGAWD